MKVRVSNINIDEDEKRYTISVTASDARVTAKFTLGSGKHRYWYRTQKERDKSLWELRGEASTEVADFCKRLVSEIERPKAR